MKEAAFPIIFGLRFLCRQTVAGLIYNLTSHNEHKCETWDIEALPSLVDQHPMVARGLRSTVATPLLTLDTPYQSIMVLGVYVHFLRGEVSSGASSVTLGVHITSSIFSNIMSERIQPLLVHSPHLQGYGCHPVSFCPFLAIPFIVFH
jgi:hypothetical protein